MLVEFRVSNYRSFKDQVSLNMLAENIISSDKTLDESNIFRHQNTNLLKSAVIYGANASGKSNLLKAFSTMRTIVISSSTEGRTGYLLPVQPFLLSEQTHNGSTFEVIFYVDKVKYRYGFKSSKERINEEWLYQTVKIKERVLFERDEDSIKISRNFSEGKGIESKTRPNALFISVVDQFNGLISGSIIRWFNNTLVIFDNVSIIEQYTLQRLSDPKAMETIKNYLKSFDVGIDGLKIEKLEVQDIIKELPVNFKGLFSGAELPEFINSLRSIHNVYNKEGDVVGKVEFDFNSEESDGTKKLMSLSAPILDALSSGRVVLIDELDSSLHPLLCEKLVEFFHNNNLNISNAQIIFTTHNVNLLRSNTFRRDQIWFVEKTRQGVSSIYSLLEYRVRNDANFSKDYLNGRYGAIPFVNVDLFLGEFHKNV